MLEELRHRRGDGVPLTVRERAIWGTRAAPCLAIHQSSSVRKVRKVCSRRASAVVGVAAVMPAVVSASRSAVGRVPARRARMRLSAQQRVASPARG